MQAENNGNWRRVVITGYGLVTPIGNNVPDAWAAIRAGQSGLGDFTLIERGDHQVGGVCEVKGFDPVAVIGRRDARRRDRYQQLASVAAIEAMEQSGLQVTDDNNGVRPKRTARRTRGRYGHFGFGPVWKLCRRPSIRNRTQGEVLYVYVHACGTLGASRPNSGGHGGPTQRLRARLEASCRFGLTPSFTGWNRPQTPQIAFAHHLVC